MKHRRFFSKPLQHPTLSKLAHYGEQKFAKLQAAWHRIYGSQSRTKQHSSSSPSQTDTNSFRQKIQKKRISQRQSAFQQSGGHESSLVSYGLDKARNQDDEA
ncbi:hypothetical protein QUF64_12485 [Anaerolineales bacterium HSG6]|nr:hypothetical protein [Anaerolineales bacterium HSG6]MDM8531947.1 hypothetical protein [Anaerolineales bacterium HSG25]